MRSGLSLIFSWRARRSRRAYGRSAMIGFNRKESVRVFVLVAGVTGLLAVNAMAQYSGGGGGTTGATPVATTGAYNLHNNYHLGFDRPEAWGLKYFAST